jgi:hypothetical protein
MWYREVGHAAEQSRNPVDRLAAAHGVFDKGTRLSNFAEDDGIVCEFDAGLPSSDTDDVIER